MKKQPNVVFLFADQWRQQATGYAGDPNVKTPNLDALALESVNFTHALSGRPVCSPYRASLLTGQRPLTHGVFVNDVVTDAEMPRGGDVEFVRGGEDGGVRVRVIAFGYGFPDCLAETKLLGRRGVDYLVQLACFFPQPELSV